MLLKLSRFSILHQKRFPIRAPMVRALYVKFKFSGFLVAELIIIGTNKYDYLYHTARTVVYSQEYNYVFIVYSRSNIINYTKLISKK